MDDAATNIIECIHCQQNLRIPALLFRRTSCLKFLNNSPVHCMRLKESRRNRRARKNLNPCEQITCDNLSIVPFHRRFPLVFLIFSVILIILWNNLKVLMDWKCFSSLI
jgi:hypothetical protein